MKIAVFGATGGAGRQVVEQALAAGHQVSALARNPAKLALTNDNLTIVA
ncbi:MAG: NAD(P)H-binding protein, partial [Anaerolineae bacterium]